MRKLKFAQLLHLTHVRYVCVKFLQCINIGDKMYVTQRLIFRMTAVEQQALYLQSEQTKSYNDEELDKELDWFIDRRSSQQVMLFFSYSSAISIL